MKAYDTWTWKGGEQVDTRYRHRENWKFIKEFRGINYVKAGVIKRKYMEDRINNWYEYFTQLLLIPSVVDNEEEEIMPIFKTCNIRLDVSKRKNTKQPRKN